MEPRRWAYFVLSLLLATVQAGDIESITMAQAPGFTNLRDCAQLCFEAYGRGDIFGGLSCSVNNCLCRPDLLSDAHSAISSCIYTQQCQTTNTVDLSLGLSFYDSYCSSYHAAVAGVALATTTNSDSSPTTPPSAVVTVTVTSRPTSAASTLVNTGSSLLSPPTTFMTSKPSSSESSSLPRTTNSGPSNSEPANGGGNGGGLSRSDILTIVFGVLGAVVAIVIGVWQGKRQSITRRRWREWRGEDM